MFQAYVAPTWQGNLPYASQPPQPHAVATHEAPVKIENSSMSHSSMPPEENKKEGLLKIFLSR